MMAESAKQSCFSCANSGKAKTDSGAKSGDSFLNQIDVNKAE